MELHFKWFPYLSQAEFLNSRVGYQNIFVHIEKTQVKSATEFN